MGAGYCAPPSSGELGVWWGVVQAGGPAHPSAAPPSLRDAAARAANGSARERCTVQARKLSAAAGAVRGRGSAAVTLAPLIGADAAGPAITPTPSGMMGPCCGLLRPLIGAMAAMAGHVALAAPQQTHPWGGAPRTSPPAAGLSAFAALAARLTSSVLQQAAAAWRPSR